MPDNLAIPTVRQVRIIEAAQRTGCIQGRMAKVISGTLEPEFYNSVVVPAYQRGTINGDKPDELMEALAPDGIGILDDLLLCVRTDSFDVIGGGTIIIPTTAIHVLDGRQRMAAACARLLLGLRTQSFGVKIYLGTTEEEERNAFRQFNRKHTEVSTDVFLRNSATNAAIEALKELVENEPNMPQVKWDHVRHNEDISARMLYEVAIILHGGPKCKDVDQIEEQLTKISKTYGTALLTQNVKTFFETIRKTFGDNELSEYMHRINMLRALAELFSDHSDFWDVKNPSKLLVRIPDLRKLQALKPRTVREHLGRSDARAALYQEMVRQIDRGRSGGTRLSLRSSRSPEKEA